MREKKFINYEQYGDLINQLVEKLKLLKGISDMIYVYGPSRGGLPIAVHVSHFLKLKFVLDMTTLDQKQKRYLLVVDDIVHKGRTFTGISHGEPVGLFASLHYKTTSEFRPDVFVEETMTWIVYPWERSDEIPNRED